MNHDIQRLLSCRFVFKIKMPSDVRVQLINDLADIEYGPLLVHLVHLMIYHLVAIGVNNRVELTGSVTMISVKNH